MLGKAGTEILADRGGDGESDSLLVRLYKTKLAWVTAAIAVVGLGILVLGIRSSKWTAHRWDWLHNVPLDVLGSTLLSTGLVIVLFEYLGHKELEDRAISRLRRVLPEQEAILRKAILDGFAFDPASIAAIASDEAIDAAVRNCLAIRLQDPELAREVYKDVRQQVVKASERWRDLQIVITLGKANLGPAKGRGSMFRASLKWRFRTTLVFDQLTFACVDEMAMYRELLGQATTRQVWYFERIGDLTAEHPSVFNVSGASVEGQRLDVQTEVRDGGRRFTVTGPALTENLGKEVLLEYSYEVLVQRNSHLIVIDVAQPSKSVTASLLYGDCGIRFVNVLDFFAGPAQARIGRSSRDAPIQSVEASFDGWVFPKSGVAFVWILEDEMLRDEIITGENADGPAAIALTPEEGTLQSPDGGLPPLSAPAKLQQDRQSPGPP